MLYPGVHSVGIQRQGQTGATHGHNMDRRRRTGQSFRDTSPGASAHHATLYPMRPHQGPTTATPRAIQHPTSRQSAQQTLPHAPSTSGQPQPPREPFDTRARRLSALCIPYLMCPVKGRHRYPEIHLHQTREPDASERYAHPTPSVATPAIHIDVPVRDEPITAQTHTR